MTELLNKKYAKIFKKQISQLVEPVTEETKLFYFLRTKIKGSSLVSKGYVEALVVTANNVEILDQYELESDFKLESGLPMFSRTLQGVTE